MNRDRSRLPWIRLAESWGPRVVAWSLPGVLAGSIAVATPASASVVLAGPECTALADVALPADSVAHADVVAPAAADVAHGPAVRPVEAAAVSAEQVETLHPNGAVHERYSVDATGRKNGPYEEYRLDGTLLRRCAFSGDVLQGRSEEFDLDGKTVLASGDYRQGERQGTWVTFSLATSRRKKVEYKAGVIEGAVTVYSGDKVLSRQRWKDGQLEKLDDVVPFPIPAAKLLEKLAKIQAPPAEPFDTAKDPLAPMRHQGLRRLQAYRALCGLGYEGMTLVPEWNDLCQAASEVCKANGAISHTPPKPAGIDDARYRQAQLGASRSNLSLGSDIPGSVDGYMDDSDPSNIDRLGHRRWCLNPSMGKTGFGYVDGFSAMWSMDESGKGAKNLDAVLYPPAGWCPVDMFGAGHAFSIQFLKSGAPKLADVRVSIRPLDEDWIAGDPLTLDHLKVADGGYGSGACLAFRPKGLVVSVGKRYLVEVSTDAGRSFAFRHVVAFCEASPVVPRGK